MLKLVLVICAGLVCNEREVPLYGTKVPDAAMCGMIGATLAPQLLTEGEVLKSWRCDNAD